MRQRKVAGEMSGLHLYRKQYLFVHCFSKKMKKLNLVTTVRICSQSSHVIKSPEVSVSWCSVESANILPPLFNDDTFNPSFLIIYYFC